MAVTSRPKPTDHHHHHHLPLSSKWRHREELSPERTKVWSEPNPKVKSQRKVAVVYYLSRDGHLQQPHFMEVPLASPEGLYLRDVISRLNLLRGKGMASMYSWSSKRSYKHGYVWQDLSENDFIYPSHGLEYVLKGSELVEGCAKLPEGIQKPGEDSKESDSAVVIRRRNQSWSDVDLHEYKVYKSDVTGEFAGKAADAATQTDDKARGRRRRSIREEEVEEEEEKTELNREEISPPPSSSSSETLETLIKSEGGNIHASRGGNGNGNGNGNESVDRDHPTVGMHRMKASTVLMQLLSCGSFSVKECGTGRHRGLPVISEYGGVGDEVSKELRVRDDSMFGDVEEKMYFSGSLVETKKKDFGGLKRSASYNADRSLKMDLKDKEIDGVRARCMPRRPKNIPAKKQTSNNPADIGSSDSAVHGSKRFGEVPKSNKDTVVP